MVSCTWQDRQEGGWCVGDVRLSEESLLQAHCDVTGKKVSECVCLSLYVGKSIRWGQDGVLVRKRYVIGNAHRTQEEERTEEGTLLLDNKVAVSVGTL